LTAVLGELLIQKPEREEVIFDKIHLTNSEYLEHADQQIWRQKQKIHHWIK
jgi:hypothetical protein